MALEWLVVTLICAGNVHVNPGIDLAKNCVTTFDSLNATRRILHIWHPRATTINSWTSKKLCETYIKDFYNMTSYLTKRHLVMGCLAVDRGRLLNQ